MDKENEISKAVIRFNLRNQLSLQKIKNAQTLHSF